MTENVLVNDAARVLSLPSDFEVSWAGPAPSWIDADFCFGSDDGGLLFTSIDKDQVRFTPEMISENEAINGVAFLDNRQIAMSSRNELAFMSIAARLGAKPKRATVEVGAHGVIATKSGHFVAPLGVSGVMVLKPGENKHSVNIQRCDHPVNFYKAISLCHDGTETLAFAARHGGVLETQILPGSPEPTTLDNFRCFQFKDLDVVDICSLGWRLAAAVGKDGTLILFRDILSTDRPMTITFPNVAGTSYGILSANEHIVVLTSQALYIFKDLARRFLESRPVNREATFVRSFEIEAVDMNLYRDSKLLMVLTDTVVMADVQSLLAETANSPTGPSASTLPHEANDGFASITTFVKAEACPATVLPLTLA